MGFEMKSSVEIRQEIADFIDKNTPNLHPHDNVVKALWIKKEELIAAVLAEHIVKYHTKPGADKT
jgi:hypothetical protein